VRVAVVGCGIGGMAAAVLLARAGHSVTIFEEFETPRPIGAGLTLQPSGLAALRALGLEDAILDCGARLRQLYGDTPRGRAVMDLHYSDHRPDTFGVGIQRGALFQLLYDATRAEGIEIRAGARVVAVADGGSDARLETAAEALAFDLILVANGSDTRLRAASGRVRRNRPYKWGAVWGVVPPPPGWPMDRLLNRYVGAGVMIGALPVGKLPGQGPDGDRLTFFWSLPVAEWEPLRARPFDTWKAEVSDWWPEIGPVIDGFGGYEDLTVARYRDAVMRPVARNRVGLIGDAAHAMSPQLGQGANLALLDAMVLAQELARGEGTTAALRAYEKRRRPHWRYYQLLSRALTPFFQSRSKLAGWARDVSFPLARRFGPTRRLTARTLCGEIFSKSTFHAAPPRAGVSIQE
jgi:2-polyprenyl-6-methoxyphenol hydroxylase-like FAD-dependent oxidoreductase